MLPNERPQAELRIQAVVATMGFSRFDSGRPHCGQPTGSETRPRLEICDRVKVHFTIARFTGRSFVAQDYRES